MKKAYACLVVLLLSGQGSLAQGINENVLQGLAYLNNQRAAAGLSTLEWDTALSAAAQDHASYLANNRLSGHVQDAGLPGFTGVSSSDRAIARGYASRNVLENVHVSVSNPPQGFKQAIDGLFTAIYHRILFLEGQVNRVGFALAGQDYRAVVFKLADGVVARMCTKKAAKPVPGRYVTQICDDLSRELNYARLSKLQSQQYGELPQIVVWPPDGATGQPPAFAAEEPDPLPDLLVSGNPISIHFNVDDEERLKVISFTLSVGGERVKQVRYMSAENDPNQVLTRADHVLFPLQRLKWGATYEARVRYQIAGKEAEKTWSFSIHAPTPPFFEISEPSRLFTCCQDNKE